MRRQRTRKSRRRPRMRSDRGTMDLRSCKEMARRIETARSLHPCRAAERGARQGDATGASPRVPADPATLPPHAPSPRDRARGGPAARANGSGPAPAAPTAPAAPAPLLFLSPRRKLGQAEAQQGHRQATTPKATIHSMPAGHVHQPAIGGIHAVSPSSLSRIGRPRRQIRCWGFESRPPAAARVCRICPRWQAPRPRRAGRRCAGAEPRK